MGKTSKIVVCGPSGCGKTALIEQLIYGRYDVSTKVYSTIEDTYVALVETDRGVKEKVRIYDLGSHKSTLLPEKHYIATADAFILVYDVTNNTSFKQIQKLKKDIDVNKEKREIAIIVIGNKSDLEENRDVDKSIADKWALKEKVRHFEVSALRRPSLVDAFVSVVSKLTQPPSKSGFPFGKKEQK